MNKRIAEFEHYLKEFLRGVSSTPSSRLYFGVLAGRLFENVAIRALVLGGAFHIRRQPHQPLPAPVRMMTRGLNRVATTLHVATDPETVQYTKINEQDVYFIVDEAVDMGRMIAAAGITPQNAANSGQPVVAAAAAAVVCFGVPSNPNFPSIDAMRVTPSDNQHRHGLVEFYQMKNVTSATKCSIKYSHLQRYISYFPANVTVRLYQVVPVQHWEHAKNHGFEYIVRDATDTAWVPADPNNPHGKPDRVNEFAMRIEEIESVIKTVYEVSN